MSSKATAKPEAVPDPVPDPVPETVLERPAGDPPANDEVPTGPETPAETDEPQAAAQEPEGPAQEGEPVPPPPEQAIASDCSICRRAANCVVWQSFTGAVQQALGNSQTQIPGIELKPSLSVVCPEFAMTPEVEAAVRAQMATAAAATAAAAASPPTE